VFGIFMNAIHEVSFAVMRLRITAGGQVSIPAEVRRRWSTRELELEDQGDRIVLRPAAIDAIAAARGSLGGRSSADLRGIARRDEEAAGSRRR
jgi:AbrB family looped-hinge helix DNA binding protein